MFPPSAFMCSVIPKYNKIRENQIMAIVSVRLRYVLLKSVRTETFSFAFSGACNWSWKFSANVILFLLAIRWINCPRLSMRPRANNHRGDSGKLNLTDRVKVIWFNWTAPRQVAHPTPLTKGGEGNSTEYFRRVVSFANPVLHRRFHWLLCTRWATATDSRCQQRSCMGHWLAPRPTQSLRPARPLMWCHLWTAAPWTWGGWRRRRAIYLEVKLSLVTSKSLFVSKWPGD